MAKDDSKRNAGVPSAKGRRAEKADALRANLRKRKAQAREKEGNQPASEKLPPSDSDPH